MTHMPLKYVAKLQKLSETNAIFQNNIYLTVMKIPPTDCQWLAPDVADTSQNQKQTLTINMLQTSL